MDRRLVAALGLFVAIAVVGAGRAQDATPIAVQPGNVISVEATPVGDPGCQTGPATPTSQFRTVNQEIAIDLDRLFACLAVRDWAGARSFTAISAGAADPFSLLADLSASGLFAVHTTLVSQTVRSTGPSGARVDLAWRVGHQLRYERWTFVKVGGLWLIVAVEPGLPLYDGAIVGFTGAIGPDGASLARSEVISPGGVEILFEIAPDVPSDAALLVFPMETCARAQASLLTASLDLAGASVTLSLDALDPGSYALALVSTGTPLTRDAICAAPTTVLKITA